MTSFRTPRPLLASNGYDFASPVPNSLRLPCRLASVDLLEHLASIPSGLPIGYNTRAHPTVVDQRYVIFIRWQVNMGCNCMRSRKPRTAA